MNPARHVKIAFDLFKYGIMKRRLLEGEARDLDDWTSGHPAALPEHSGASARRRARRCQIRVPVDDTHDPVRLSHHAARAGRQ